MVARRGVYTKIGLKFLDAKGLTRVAVRERWAYYVGVMLNKGWPLRSSAVHLPKTTKTPMRYFAASLVLLAFFALGGSAEAQPFRAREGVESGQVQALDRILEAIRRSQPGRLSDVQGPDIGPFGEPHYRIKWLTPDGRVLWLDTDARTGRVLGIEGDRGGPPPRAVPRPGFIPRGPQAGQDDPPPPDGDNAGRFGGRGRFFPPGGRDGDRGYGRGRVFEPDPQGDDNGPPRGPRRRFPGGR